MYSRLLVFGSDFIQLPFMAYARSDSCMVAVDGKSLFIAGGLNGSETLASADIYVKNKARWNRFADMPTARADVACGLVYRNRGSEIWIAGGRFMSSALKSFPSILGLRL
jgi:hypothetical protein